MFGCAYPLSYTYDTSQAEVGVFRRLGKRVRSRFSRQSKPIDHIGGTPPEARVPRVFTVVSFKHGLIDEDQDLEFWSNKPGSTLEEFDISLG